MDPQQIFAKKQTDMVMHFEYVYIMSFATLVFTVFILLLKQMGLLKLEIGVAASLCYKHWHWILVRYNFLLPYVVLWLHDLQAAKKADLKSVLFWLTC